jgi:cytochrome bd-type quinol oxidase subunit 2
MWGYIWLVVYALAVITPVVIVVATLVDLTDKPSHRSTIIGKSLLGLAAWFVLTAGAMFVAFINVYGVAHTEYARTHGRVSPEEASRVDEALVIIGISYCVVCGWIAYRVFRSPKRSRDPDGAL